MRLSSSYALEGVFITERLPNENLPALKYDYAVFSVELGKRIKQLRKDRGITLRTLIVDHGFHLTQIQRIERGNGISIPTLLHLAETFCIPVGQLVSNIGEVGPQTSGS